MAPRITHAQRPNFHELPISRGAALALGAKYYFTGIPCKNGHISHRRTVKCSCVECVRVSSAAVRHEKRRKLYKHPPDRMERLRKSNPLALLFQWARYRAKSKGIEFSIKPEDVLAPSKCPCCGVTLVSESRLRAKNDAMTLDRTDNSKGYVQGNVAVICFACNTIKGSASLNDLRRIVRYLEKLSPAV